MKRLPKISIVITCFNYEQFVGSAIESAINQSDQPDEIVVVDDGSTDGSRNVIAGFGSRVKTLFQENAGTSAAFNAGYFASSGDVVMFLDADDTLLPEAIARVRAAWQEGLAKAQFNLEIIDRHGATLGRKFCSFPRSYASPEGPAADFSSKGTYIWPVTSGNAYARDFLAKVMPMHPPVSCDGVLNSIAPIYGQVLTIDAILGQYRLHGQNISRHNALGRPQKYPDFPKRIAYRKQEVAILRQHCDAQKYPHIQGNILDKEIVFINYRLAARRLGKAYVDSDLDSVAKLWLRGVTLALTDPLPLSLRMKHVIWFTSLAVVPARFAESLILLRFNRADILEEVRGLIA